MVGAANSTPLRGRLATRADDATLRRFVAGLAMPGPVALAVACEPNFFDALEVLGRDPRVLVGERGDRVLAAGVIARRTVFLNGAPRELGYLGGLRLAPDVRGTAALARGYRLFRALHPAYLPGAFYLSAILDGNAAARRILTSGRAGLPAYRELTRVRTLLFPPSRRRPRSGAGGLAVVRGGTVGAAALAAFLQDAGARRQFFPVCTAEDLARDGAGGPWRGLRLDDFLVAVRDGRIVGTLAVWDQTAFRQHVVTGYARAWRPWIGLGRALARLARLPALPRPGQPLRDLLAACLAVAGDAPAVCARLLREARCEAGRRGALCLALALAPSDPLAAVLRRPPHVTLGSRLFAVDWGDAAAMLAGMDRRPIHVEAGSL